MKFKFDNLYLENEWLSIKPITENDFEILFEVAKDPEIWEQHPNNDRYKKDVFRKFFDDALQSKGGYLVFDQSNQKLIGSTRFYDYDVSKSSIALGYTFLAKSHWGGKYNFALKKLMVNYALKLVSTVVFHIGPLNIRSQKALEKIGGVQTKLVDATATKPAFYEYELKTPLI